MERRHYSGSQRPPALPGPHLPAPRRGRWGGFLLSHREPQLVHARLTGRLSSQTLAELDRRLVAIARTQTTTFLLLDASSLEHVPMQVAEELSRRDRRWRKRGIVALWIGLSRYLANVLLLACSAEDLLPALPNLEMATRLIGPVRKVPATVARGRLEMCGSLVH